MTQLAFKSGNPVFKDHGMEAEVILASIAPGCPRITTIRIRCPRSIWPEPLTHRAFSRNARSSRAVPFNTLMAELQNGGAFVPWLWTSNQKGMQGKVGHNSMIGNFDNEQAWQNSMEWALDWAAGFNRAGYHKQVVNRIIEPYMMIDALITATDWENFWWLRDHGDAEPHLQALAVIMKKAYDAANVQELEEGEYHLPYITYDDEYRLLVRSYSVENPQSVIDGSLDPTDALIRISAARCARISYSVFGGSSSYQAELDRYDMLVKSDRVHASPLEHQAWPDSKKRIAVTDVVEGTEDTLDPDTSRIMTVWKNPDLHGNFTGWIQYRQTVPNQCRQEAHNAT